MDTLRAVVCGTTFGRVYASAIRRLPEHYELVGLLSRGSSQSRRCAGELGVPLATSPEELPEADVACVVVRSGIVGGAGSQLAQRFLASGTHVLLEHPIHRDDAVACYRAAASSGAVFMVNPFYRHTATIATYLDLARALGAEHGITLIEAECSIPFLFSMVDILGRITGGFSPWDVEETARATGAVTELSVRLRGISVALRVVNRLNPDNPDDVAHAGHRITVLSPAGSLVLGESDGRIDWHPAVLIPRDADGVLEADPRDPLSTAILHESLDVEQNVTRLAQVERIWPAAAARFLHDAHAAITGPGTDPREAEYTLALCSVWSRIGQVLGPPEREPWPGDPGHVSLRRLQELAGQERR